MSVPEPAGLKPHDRAKAEIDAWRGRCLNYFSRGERAVTESLIGVRAKLPDLRLEPLAGQRLNSLDKLAQTDSATEAQKAALMKAIALWRLHDEKRPFFSHGVFVELLDRNEQWHAQIDFVTVQKGVCEPRRMNLSKAEAEEFEKGLQEAFKALSGQLGQFRKRLAS